jgi:hypothetical protein
MPTLPIVTRRNATVTAAALILGGSLATIVAHRSADSTSSALAGCGPRAICSLQKSATPGWGSPTTPVGTSGKADGPATAKATTTSRPVPLSGSTDGTTGWDSIYRGTGYATFQEASGPSQSFPAPAMFFADFITGSTTDIYTVSGSDSLTSGSWTVELKFAHHDVRSLTFVGVTVPQPYQISYNFPLGQALPWLDLGVGGSQTVSTTDDVYLVTLSRPQMETWQFAIHHNPTAPNWQFEATSVTLTIRGDSAAPPWRTFALVAAVDSGPPKQENRFSFGLVFCAGRGSACPS